MPDNTTDTTRRTILKTGSIATVGLTGVAGCIGDGDVGGELQAAVPTPDHPYTWAMESFIDHVHEISDDRIQINLDSSGAYGDEIEQWETLSAGGIDIASASILVSHATYLPESISGVTNMAFVLQEPIREHFRNIVSEVDEQEGLRDIFRENNLEPLGEPIWTGNRHVLASEAIRQPDDINGLPIRVPELVGWPEWFSEVGFSPQTLAYGETYTGLQTGTIEGAEGEIFQILADGWYEQADFYNLMGYYPNSLRLLMNVDAYENLSEEDKGVFDEAYANALEDTEERIENEEEDGFDELREAGIEIVDDVDVEAFEERARPVIEEWLEDNDAALQMEDIEDLAP